MIYNTKKILYHSLEEQLKKHHIEKVTVKDIVDNCHLSRSVFYKYFYDKYDLMNWPFECFLETLTEPIYQTKDWEAALGQITDYIFINKDYYSSIVHYSSQNAFTDFFIKEGVKVTEKLLLDSHDSGQQLADIKVSISIYSSICANLIAEWIKKGYDRSPQQMTKLMLDNIPLCLVPYYRGLDHNEPEGYTMH